MQTPPFTERESSTSSPAGEGSSAFNALAGYIFGGKPVCVWLRGFRLLMMTRGVKVCQSLCVCVWAAGGGGGVYTKCKQQNHSLILMTMPLPSPEVDLEDQQWQESACISVQTQALS
jgi:hypothetical protein